MILRNNFERILSETKNYNADLVAVSKKKPVEDIRELINYGQLKFGENYVQELINKHKELPDSEWHFIGHLQTNKVKQIIPFTRLIQGVDSLKLLKEINKQSEISGHIQDCLLQIHISKEETKYGLSEEELGNILNENVKQLKNVNVKGLMGMASNTEDNDLIRNEFRSLRKLFDNFKSSGLSVLSMGMTSDYKIALEEGSTLIRIGSAIFGAR